MQVKNTKALYYRKIQHCICGADLELEEKDLRWDDLHNTAYYKCPCCGSKMQASQTAIKENGLNITTAGVRCNEEDRKNLVGVMAFLAGLTGAIGFVVLLLLICTEVLVI